MGQSDWPGWRCARPAEKAAAIEALIARGVEYARDIASELGAPSKNAVIGLCRRAAIKLPVECDGINQFTGTLRPRKPESVVKAERKRRPTTVRRKPSAVDLILRKISRDQRVKPRRPVVSREPYIFDEMLVTTLMERRMHGAHKQCAWPVDMAIGAPLTGEMQVCGQKAADGSSYCGHHHGIAYPRDERRAEA